MPLKIVHITEAWAGGISTYVQNVIEYQQQSANIESITIIYSRNRSGNIHDNFSRFDKVKLIPYKSSRNIFLTPCISLKINRLLKGVNPDIVHLHSSFPGIYGRIIKHFPTIYCAHGWSFVQESGCCKKFIYSIVEKFLARKTDAIINISQHEDNQAKSAGITAKINRVILSGIRDTQIDGSTPIKLKEKCINIGFIGRLDYKKGFDIVERFFRKTHLENIHLYAIGAADRDLMEFKECGNVSYLGWVDNNNIDNYISQLDAIIIPSRQEAFGLVALEAMRNAKPIIAHNYGALPELVKNGINGYLYNNINELENIINSLDKAQLAIMGKNAHELFKANYTLDKMAEKILSVYSEVRACW